GRAADLLVVDQVQGAPVRVIGDQQPKHVSNRVRGSDAFGERAADSRADGPLPYGARLTTAGAGHDHGGHARGNGDTRQNGSQHQERDYFTCRPPSMRSVSPVMKSLSISARTPF